MRIEAGIERAIKITETDTTFEFTVETTGSLTPEQVVRKALGVLCNKLSMLRDMV